MEHIPQAIDNPHPSIQVPYLVTENFEHIIRYHSDVHAEIDYDDDSGNAFLAVTEGNTTTQAFQKEEDIFGFYQARCYFGLLWNVYSLAEKQLDVGLYLDRKEEITVVTTKVLMKELDSIASKEHSLPDDAKIEKYIKVGRFIEPVQSLTAQLHTYVAERLDSMKVSNDVLCDTSQQSFWVLQVVIESTTMLSETILTAARHMYLPSSSISPAVLEPIWGRDLPPAPPNMLCTERFRKAGWCPRQVAETSETTLGSRSVLFSLSSIDKSGALYGTHNQCSVESCVLEDIDNDTYQPLHTSDCEDGSCPFVPKATKSGRNDASTIIARIVRKGWIPVINLVEQPSSPPLLSIKAYQPGHERGGPTLRKRKRSGPKYDVMEKIVKLYDPIPKEKPTNNHKRAPMNSKRGRHSLGDMARLIYPEDTDEASLQYIATSHVWAQGLGNRNLNAIPLCQLRRIQNFVNDLAPEHLHPMPFWIDTICVPLDTTTRTMAIKEMRTVYRDALAVLVIDRSLTELDLTNVETQEFGGSGMTNWQLDLLMRIKASPWAQRLWTYHEAWLAKDLYFQIGEQDTPAIHSQDIVAPRPRKTFNPFNQREQETETQRQLKLIEDTEAVTNEDVDLPSESEISMLPLEYTAAYLLVEATALQLFGRFSSEEQLHVFRDDLRYLSRQLAVRTTSRLQDEAICLSALLGLEAAAVMADAQGEAVPDEDRMRRLWEILDPGDIPAEILFCNRPIYGHHGCGWMPRSLLRDNRGNLINSMRCGQALKKHERHGILVEMGGFGFEIPDDAQPGLSPWKVMLKVAEYKYRLSEVEASASMNDWRASVSSGKFAVLMPQNELRMLLENVEDRVDGSRSHSSDLPFGLLVNVLETPMLQDEVSYICELGSLEAIYVVRREMVELEIMRDDEEESESDVEGEPRDDGADSDSLGLSFEGELVVPTETQVFYPGTRKWWVG